MARNKPYYPLAKVRELASTDDKCIINNRARTSAKNDFGWNQAEIKKAISKLQPKHFYKSDYKYDNPCIHVDYYKAYNLMGENLYIHFRIENEYLVICSFKEI